jgi:putative mycofactocin binding protein MftB
MDGNDAGTSFDAGRPYEKHPQGNRRLVFLKSPALADVVETLSQFPSAAGALAAHVPASQRDAYGKALSGLLTSGVIRAR